jgi:hypothetical protein
MPMDTIKEIFKQCNALGHNRRICLNRYDEPFMDPRMADIIRMAKEEGDHFVYLCSNGDFITKEIAREVDGVLDRIVLGLYVWGEPERTERKRWFRSLFQKTHLYIKGGHSITHFGAGYLESAEKYKDGPCNKFNLRMSINHRGQYVMCCEDIAGVFDMGTFPEVSLKDYWYGSKRREIFNDLYFAGGRHKHEHCITCPR